MSVVGLHAVKPWWSHRGLGNYLGRTKTQDRGTSHKTNRKPDVYNGFTSIRLGLTWREVLLGKWKTKVR